MGKTPLFCSRSLHGERGLKQWSGNALNTNPGRSLHGERGLKRSITSTTLWLTCRSLHGERGLKPALAAFTAAFLGVAPFTGSVD